MAPGSRLRGPGQAGRGSLARNVSRPCSTAVTLAHSSGRVAPRCATPASQAPRPAVAGPRLCCPRRRLGSVAAARASEALLRIARSRTSASLGRGPRARSRRRVDCAATGAGAGSYPPPLPPAMRAISSIGRTCTEALPGGRARAALGPDRVLAQRPAPTPRGSSAAGARGAGARSARPDARPPPQRATGWRSR